MTERIQKTKQTRKEVREEAAAETTKPVDADKLKADLDAILDEIDEVLTSEAEALVAGFVQKGGE